MVCDEMMDIMAALPPANRETTAEIGDEESDESVDDKVVGDSTMTSIVCCKHYLLLGESQSGCLFFMDLKSGIDGAYPKQSKETCRGHIPSVM